MADDQDVAKELKVEKAPIPEKRFKDYESFWPFYLKEHSKVTSAKCLPKAQCCELRSVQRKQHCSDGAME
jgi:hypothetical protein